MKNAILVLAFLWTSPLVVFKLFPILTMTPFFTAFLFLGMVPFALFTAYCLFLGIIIIVNSLLRRPIDKNQLFRIKVCFLSVFGLFISTKILLWTGPHYPYMSNGKKFDSNAWIEKKEDTTSTYFKVSTRQMMTTDLIENKLRGLKKEEVLKMLGQPSKGAPWWKVDLIYHTGLERENWLRMDDEWLFVEFDKDGFVNRAYLHTD